MENIIEKLKEFVSHEKEKNRREKQMFYMKEALRNFDLVRINEILESDFSLQMYEEQNGSSITHAFLGFENQLFEGYLTRRKRIDDSIKTIYKYLATEKEKLSPEVTQYLEQLNEKLLYILERLYQKGANINIEECTSLNSNLFNPKKEVHEVDSPLLVMLSFLDMVKTDKCIDWLLAKPEIDLSQKKSNRSILERVLSQHAQLSISVLIRLLQRGVKIYDFQMPAPYSALTPVISDLHLCLLKSPIETRTAKLKILYQYATPEQIELFEKCQGAQNIDSKVVRN